MRKRNESYEGEKQTDMIQIHDCLAGEARRIPCPHCKKKIRFDFIGMEADPDAIAIYWGKNRREVERIQRNEEKRLNSTITPPRKDRPLPNPGAAATCEGSPR